MPKHRLQGQRMVANTGTDLSINKIKRAPGLKYTVVPCLDCGAEVGQPCLTRSGKRHGQGHKVRRHHAVQKLYGEGA